MAVKNRSTDQPGVPVNDATKFLNGAVPSAYAAVKDSDLSTSDITTNNVTSTLHGFAPKSPADTAKFLRGDTTPSWAVAFPLITQGRLTLTSTLAVTTADVTGAVSVFFTPYGGNRVALYTSSLWQLYTFTELTLAVGTLTNDLPYDVFLYDNSGTLTLESVAWTNKTTRATALTTQDGVYVKTGSTNKKYLGTFHTTSTTTTEDSATKRLLWNYYNRVARQLMRQETSASWAYTTATTRQANGNTANQLAIVQGVIESPLEITLVTSSANTNTGVLTQVGIGEDSTTSYATGSAPGSFTTAVANGQTSLVATVRRYPSAGYHFYSWNEFSSAVGATTWFGTVNGTFTGIVWG